MGWFSLSRVRKSKSSHYRYAAVQRLSPGPARERDAHAAGMQGLRGDERRARLLVRHQLELERAAHLVQLLRHRDLELLGLLLQRAHPAAHPLDLLLELEHLLDAGEVHPELARQFLDA